MIAADEQMRVFSTIGTGTRAPAKDYEACLVRSGARMTLVAPAKQDRGLHRRLDEPTLAGAVVAYLEDQFGTDAGCDDLIVANVATRMVLRRVARVGCSVDACLVHCETVTDLVVDPHGSTGWIVERGTNRGQKTLAVYSAPVSGAIVVLDEGARIGATSLALSSGTLSWWHEGMQRTATLRP